MLLPQISSSVVSEATRAELLAVLSLNYVTKSNVSIVPIAETHIQTS